MSLSQRIETDFVAAYKAKDDVRVAVLRMLKTAAKNKQVELRRPLADDELLDVLAKQVKQRQESIDQFSQAGRNDLADKERAELEVLRDYLPQALTAEETAKAVDQAVASLGATSLKDMGKVMQAVLGANKGRVDGKLVSELVKARLSS
ncbi:GatB/YqeY domain-containing protein [Fundidesulfovibrio butyratiphilus]